MLVLHNDKGAITWTNRGFNLYALDKGQPFFIGLFSTLENAVNYGKQMGLHFDPKQKEAYTGKSCIACECLTIQNTCRISGKSVRNINGMPPECPGKLNREIY